MALNSPVPSLDFDVLQRNMQDADTFVNSPLLQFTNRPSPNGKSTTKTLAGIDAEANAVIDAYRATYIGDYVLPNKQFTAKGQFVMWAVGDGGDGNAYVYIGPESALPYATDIATYPDPSNDPQLQVSPTVTALYVQQQDINRQKTTTGLNRINSNVIAGINLFDHIGDGLYVGGAGLWVVPGVTADGSPMPNPALLDSIPTTNIATVNGGVKVGIDNYSDIGKATIRKPGYSIASLPRLFRKLEEWNEATSTEIKIVGMGSSVGNGATLPNPSTQAPVIKFAEYFNDKFNKLGNLTINVVNESVDGSTLNGGTSIIDAVLAAEQPDVILLCYGMNDGATAQYNGNMTYPFVYKNIQIIVDKCRAADCEVVVTTTPHPNSAINGWSMPVSIPMVYPSFVAAPVPDASLIPPVSASIKNIDYRGDGGSIAVSHRHYRTNEAMRRAAIDLGLPLIDTERYWFDGVVRYTESALFNTLETVHPNLLGHKVSYWDSMLDFMEGVSESYHNGVQQNNCFNGRIGINKIDPQSELHIKQRGAPLSDDIFTLEKSDGTVILEVDSNGDLTAQGGSNQNFGEFVSQKEITQGTDYKRQVRAKLNKAPVDGAQLLPTDSESAGTIVVFGKGGGNTQMTSHAYINDGVNVVIQEQAAFGTFVYTIGVSGQNITLTALVANSNMAYTIDTVKV